MSRLKQITRTRRRKAVLSAISALLLVAAVSAAYLLATITFTGSGTATTEKATASPIAETLTVTVPAVNVSATGDTPFTVSTKSVPQARTLAAGAKLSAIFTTVPSSCPASAFTLEYSGIETLSTKLMTGGQSKEAITFPANTATPITGLQIRYTLSETEDQTTCSEAKLTVAVTLTGNGH